MKLNNPEFYLGKKVRVYFVDGDIIVGRLDGFNYDYSNDESLFVELDMTILLGKTKGTSFGFTNMEINQIEVIEM